MKSLRWMTDEYEGARHPWKLTATTFSIIWLAVTPYAYYRWAHRNLFAAALVGTGFGVVMSILVLAKIGQLLGWPTWIVGQGDGLLLPRDPQTPLRGSGRLVFRWHFVVLCCVIALALLGVALAFRSWGIAVAAMPFSALAAVLTVLRRRL
jgi:hypothetical protein